MWSAFLYLFLSHFTTGSILDLIPHVDPSQLTGPVYCETTRTFSSLVTGYHFEEHLVQTEDGYLLKLFRVNKGPQAVLRKPLLLIHGIVDSADDWALGDHSVVSNLARNGYDVWLLNSRGNKYSCTHATLSNESKQFWDFSFHEMGRFDVYASVKHIKLITDKKVIIVGHSQGTTQTFAAFSERPDLPEYVERFMAVAPVVYLTGFDPKNIWHYMATHHFLEAVELTGVTHILDHSINSGWSRNILLKIFCTTQLSVCGYIMSKLTDKDPRKLDRTQYQFFLKHNPSRTNLKSMRHFIQQIVHYDGALRKFDYGDPENVKRYGSIVPPAYDISKTTVPLTMYYGNNDLLTTQKNIELLRNLLPKAKVRFYDGWGHLCYFWGIDRQVFVDHLLEDIEATV